MILKNCDLLVSNLVYGWPYLTSPGLLEQYSTVRHYHEFYFNVATAATYTLPDSYTLPAKDYIYKACESLIQQHPSLSAVPVDEDTKHPYFVRLPEIDLDQPIHFQERRSPEVDSDAQQEQDLELQSLLQTQHNTGFTVPSPFWRLCVLTGASNPRCFTAVFVYHHALGDGSSGKSFHRTFLRALHDAASLSPGQAERVISSPKTPLLPNLEAIHPLPVSIRFLLSAAFKAKVWSRRDPGLWTGGKVEWPVETQVRHFALPKSHTSSLKSLCREHSTTITALLQTVVARGLFEHIPNTYSSLKCCSAVSTRRWLPNITEDSLGVWVEDYDESYKRDAIRTAQFPWPEVQRSRKTIETVLSRKGKNSSSNLLRYVRDFHGELFVSQLGNHRMTSYELSNIGTVGVDQADDSGKPIIGRMVFSQSANLVGGAIMVSTVTGGDGCLSLSFTWQKGVVEVDLIESVIESTRKELNGLVSR